jgi:sigma54-dependent transcription regulator
MIMIGVSDALRSALNLLERFSACDLPVLIEGETGTGKELAARAVHYASSRRDMPFVPINCGAIPDSLIENELFGHKKGAFTDAKEEQRGLIALAERGTLFLDEMDGLSPKGQVLLLPPTFASLLQPMSIFSSWPTKARSERTCCSGSKSSMSCFRHCGIVSRTFVSCRNIS